VLTTIIAMILGFNVVLALAMVTYLLALLALRRLQRPVAAAASPRAGAGTGDGAGDEAAEPAEPAEEVAVGAGPAGAGPVGATTP
jgi:hypothetical protein